MSLSLEIQRAAIDAGPSRALLQKWVVETLGDSPEPAELCIRIVDEQEGSRLNQRYRHKAGATNVLSFPCEASVPDLTLLGDLVICAPVVEREAQEQGKTSQAHWAHMVVHGVLHLLGYDHISEHDAIVMESEERAVLARLGFSDPYAAQAACH